MVEPYRPGRFSANILWPMHGVILLEPLTQLVLEKCTGVEPTGIGNLIMETDRKFTGSESDGRDTATTCHARVLPFDL